MNFKKNIVTAAVVATVIITLLLLSTSLFIVDEREKVVLLRFGRLEKVDVPPGIHIKVPFIDNLVRMDGRLLTIELNPQRYLTNEKKALMVDSYVQWRISDAAKYYTSTSGDSNVAHRLIGARVDTGLRNKFGEHPLNEIISGQRENLMSEITTKVDDISQNELGINVVDVRIRRIDLPDEVSESVFDRMNTERQLEARQIRANGQEAAEKIRAEADKKRTVIEAEASKKSSIIRGQGDAEAAAIYSKAYGRSPAFYSFYKRLQTYENSFANKNDLILITPNGDFLKELKK